MKCAYCKINLEYPATDARFCDICNTIIESLAQTDSMATWFINAENERRAQLAQWISEKQSAMRQ